MKKILTLISLFSFGYLSTYAQEIADGYYRVQSGLGGYISLVTSDLDEDNYASLKDGKDGNIYALRLKSASEVISDPGSIVYVRDAGNKQLVLESQGQNTYTLSNNTLYLRYSNSVLGKSSDPGTFFLYGAYAGQTRYLFDSGKQKDTDLNAAGETTKYSYLTAMGNQTSGEYTVSSKNSYWKFIPIDNTEEYYGITPETDIKVDGKYYTTVYCDFPFQVTGDMKAYYVTGCAAGKKAAKLNEIEDGIVPANMPVIIECTSDKASDNKVKVGVNATKTYSFSKAQWTGTYFSYTKKSQSGGAIENTSAKMSRLRNVTPYYESSMRVLGLSADGKLALVKAADSKLHVTDKGKYMRANKAYLKLSGAAETILLTEDGIDTSISSIQDDEKASGIYNLQGQKVNATSVDELPHGLYIINGKKVIK